MIMGGGNASCMLVDLMRWKSLVHAYDMCGGMNEDEKGDGAGYNGMPTRSKLTRVEGQGGDLPNDEVCLADLEELWQRVVKRGKKDVAEEYRERNLQGVSSYEQEMEAINGDKEGLAHIVHDDWRNSIRDEGSGAEKENGESWCWVVWNLQRKMMASPRTRLEGKRWRGCHCSKCMGASQQDGKDKWVEEAQSRAAGSGSLTENYFVAENTVGES